MKSIKWQAAEYDNNSRSLWMPDGWVLEAMAPDTSTDRWFFTVSTPGDLYTGGPAASLEDAQAQALLSYYEATGIVGPAIDRDKSSL